MKQNEQSAEEWLIDKGFYSDHPEYSMVANWLEEYAKTKTEPLEKEIEELKRTNQWHENARGELSARLESAGVLYKGAIEREEKLQEENKQLKDDKKLANDLSLSYADKVTGLNKIVAKQAERIKELEAIIKNGLGTEDLKNDIQYPAD